MEFTECSNDELADTIGRLHALKCAVEAQMLAAVAEYDRREAWRQDGAASMAGWLAYRLAAGHQSASRWAHTARRLERLPALAEAFGAGRLSGDQVLALAQVATPDTDEALAAEAPGWSASQCATLARRARKLTPADAEEAHRRRWLRWQWDQEGRLLQLSGCLAGEAGATFVAAIGHIADAARPIPTPGCSRPTRPGPPTPWRSWPPRTWGPRPAPAGPPWCCTPMCRRSAAATG